MATTQMNYNSYEFGHDGFDGVCDTYAHLPAKAKRKFGDICRVMKDEQNNNGKMSYYIHDGSDWVCVFKVS